jgi:hypothetical protein
MPKHLIPSAARTHFAEDFAVDVANSSVYAFVGYSRPRANVPDIDQTGWETLTEPYKNMLYGKRVTESDVRLMVRYIPWEINTVYDEYDDREDLDDLDYYVVVEEGTYFHYWKCISNSQGANSTSVPVFSDLNEDDVFYQVADGYVWKYICTVDEIVYNRHLTGLYSPIEANTTVSEAAAQGSIDHIAVDTAGEGYDNHLSGTFGVADIRVNGNTLTYGIGSNSSASFVNSYYTDCYCYISTGAGAGQYKRISNSYANANGRFIVVESTFSVPPTATSEFEINPRVLILGLGDITNAAARAIINTVGNTVHYVEMLSRGRGYRDAVANVIYSPVVDVSTEAELRPIIPPYGGHGYSAAQELRATRVSVMCRISNTEFDTIPATNKFQQIGLVRNPVFQDVTVNLSNVTGTFVSSENVFSVTTRYVSGANATIDSASMIFANTDVIEADDILIITNADEDSYLYTTVFEVTNSTVAVMSSDVSFSGNAIVYRVDVLASAQVSDIIDANTVVVSNLVHQYFATDDVVIGESSGARGIITTVVRQDVTKGFNTFVGMTKIVCSPVTGTFQEDEQVFQGEALANACSNGYVHSSNTDSGTTTMYVTDRFGQFDNVSIASITGANSGAVANNLVLYDSEVQHGSGTFLHLENVSEVDRANNQAEEINVILAF